MFSDAERQRRLTAVHEMMAEKGLDAMILLGNSTVSTSAYGNYRYMTDNRVIFYISPVVIPKGKETTGIAANEMSKYFLSKQSNVKNIIINPDAIAGIVSIIKDATNSNNPKVGVMLETMPASWMLKIKDALPGIDFVDVTDEMLEIRTDKSKEEVEVQIECGKVAAVGYKTICEQIKPGMYENEVLAIMDRAMQKIGAEEGFSLITSGKFDGSRSNLPPLHHTAGSNRQLEKGDVVAIEITPRYGGYWTQLVRTICVEEKNEQVEKFKNAGHAAIQEAVKIMKPGVKISELYNAMAEYVEKFTEYKISMPCGHICAVDLNEDRVSPNSKNELKEGMTVILHPTILADGMDTSIYWGETYLVTKDGAKCITECDSDLYKTE